MVYSHFIGHTTPINEKKTKMKNRKKMLSQKGERKGLMLKVLVKKLRRI